MRGEGERRTSAFFEAGAQTNRCDGAQLERGALLGQSTSRQGQSGRAALRRCGEVGNGDDDGSPRYQPTAAMFDQTDVPVDTLAHATLGKMKNENCTKEQELSTLRAPFSVKATLARGRPASSRRVTIALLHCYTLPPPFKHGKKVGSFKKKRRPNARAASISSGVFPPLLVRFSCVTTPIIHSFSCVPGWFKRCRRRRRHSSAGTSRGGHCESPSRFTFRLLSFVVFRCSQRKNLKDRSFGACFTLTALCQPANVVH